MTSRTIEIIIRISVELVDWATIILKEKLNGRKDKNDEKGNTGKKRKG